MSTTSAENAEKLRILQEKTDAAVKKANAVMGKPIPPANTTPVTTSTVAPLSKMDAWIAMVPSLSIGILGYGVLVLFITAFLIYRGKVKIPAGDGQWLIRTLVIPMCVVAAVFLTVVGYDSQQISPVIGLLGTIIGYLLGTGSRSNGTTPPADPPEKPNAATDKS